MDFEISYSVKPSELQAERFREFSDELSDIEVRLTEINGEDQSTMKSVMSKTEELDLNVKSVHGTRIRRFGSSKGVSDLMGKVRNIELGYNEEGERNLPLLRPEVIVYHPPYEDDLDISRVEQRRNMISNITYLLESDLPPMADLSLENVPKSTNLINSPEDVRITNRMAKSMGAEAPNYTLDIGHVEDDEVYEMIEAMTEGGADIVNVHVHDTLPIDDERTGTLIDKYPLEEHGELIEWQERPGIYTHLPPGEGNSDLGDAIKKLEDVGYDGPLTLELYSRFKNREGWEMARNTLENY